MKRDTCYFNIHGNETFCDVFADDIAKVIHVLDIGQFARSVTNAIDDIQLPIMQKFALEGNVGDFKWVLYGTDCVVSIYTSHDQRFEPANVIETIPWLNVKMKRLWS